MAIVSTGKIVKLCMNVYIYIDIDIDIDIFRYRYRCNCNYVYTHAVWQLLDQVHEGLHWEQGSAAGLEEPGRSHFLVPERSSPVSRLPKNIHPSCPASPKTLGTRTLSCVHIYIYRYIYHAGFTPNPTSRQGSFSSLTATQ